MDEQAAGTSGRGKNVNLGWIIAIVFILFMLWAIYTSTQTLVIESESDTMSTMDRNVTEMSSTEMPDNMPGMDH